MSADRYSRQERFAGIGAEGQARLSRARVVVVGCGALGSASAEMLTRAGVSALRVVDRDFVEASNLQRQCLFDERDAADGLPKAVAAERRLRAINAGVAIEGVVADIGVENVETLTGDADLVVDGTDNFETRFLLNDVAVRSGRPWVYGACVGSYGLALMVRPGRTPCLRCVLEERPAPGSGPTCDTAGVVAPIVHVVAGIQVAEALKLLAGREQDLLPGLISVDLWTGQWISMDLSRTPPSCPACTAARFDYADGPPEATAVLCGRDAVQVRGRDGVDLPMLAERLASAGRVSRNDYLLRFESDDANLVVFADGRAIVKGVHDVSRARTLYARYVGA